MPASRGSRAHSRREPSEEGIEDGNPSQRSHAEDADEVDELAQDADLGDDEEDAQMARHSSKKSSKKADATSTKSKSTSHPSRENDAPREAEDAIDIENFQDRSISKADGMKVAGMASDWELVSKKVKNTALSLVTEVAAAMAEAGLGSDHEPASKELVQIDIVMRELLDIQAELHAHQHSLDEIRQLIARGELVNDLLSRYDEGVKTRVEVWSQKTSRQKYGKDTDYTQFKAAIFEVQNPDIAMPPAIELIEKEAGDESDDDDEVVVGGMTQIYTCPLTLTVMVDPMTSTVCGHSFSANAIKDYLGNNRWAEKKCPGSGCNKRFKLSDLKSDKELEKKVKAFIRRERRREAQADSDMDEAEDIID